MTRASARIFISVALILLVAVPGLCRARPKAKAVSDEARQQQAFALYRSGKWADAEKALKQCVARDPREPSLNYYLGLAALYNKDRDVAERALCRVVVVSPPNSSFSKSALETLSGWRTQFHGLDQPFTQQPETLMRWETSNGPIKVCVTDGLQLPSGYYGTDMNMSKCRDIYPLLTQRSFYARLSRAPGYVPAYRDAVMAGVRDWGFLAKEGIISTEFVDDPTKADVVYVWCKQHGGGHVGMVYYPWSRTEYARCIVEIETDYANKWASNGPLELRRTSAHEFGHVLGLSVHSDNPRDVMCGTGRMISYWRSRQYENTSPVTRNDYLTLRALYEMPPDRLFEVEKW